MRLLHIESDGNLGLSKEYIGNEKTPDYAILSHTWGDQEVVFDDMRNLNSAEDIDAKDKAGWDKIRFCAQQTKRDGLEHFWVDSCCIDKSNSQELQEAINSMFRWYKNAKKCYVYLSDVERNTSDADGEAGQRWKPAFRKSRWFTRGWTLQELLAPTSVEFFSKDGERLGDKRSLHQTIYEVTGIPIEALHGRSMSRFSVEERFSWAERRQTTREEDGAYCLLGIFDICMTLRYTEGEDKAMERLRRKIQRPRKEIEERLKKIRDWLSAPDPSTNYHKAHKQRQADTGLWLLQHARFSEWKERAASSLWLYGIPGCGKTILSSTVIEHLLQYCHDDASMVTVYFYFDFNDKQKQDPELMLRSLLCQLVQRSSVSPDRVDRVFSFYESTRRQSSPQAFLNLARQVVLEFSCVYVVLDALDECTQRPELMDILKSVAGWQLDSLHVIMTSRKERDVESTLETFVKEEDAIGLQRDVVDSDIQRFIQQRLREDGSLAKWNQDAAIRQEIETALMRGARGMFRWAVCQLDTLGKCCNRAMLRKSLATLPPTLDQTYERILVSIREEYSQYATRILQWLTFSARPLYIEEIAEVVAIDVTRDLPFDREEVLQDPLEVLDICASLVTISTYKAEGKWERKLRPTQRIIALAHYSVQEYLVSGRIMQGQAKQYSMQEIECHKAMTKSCLMYLSQLQQPLTPKVLRASAIARYAAEFWTSHLRSSGDETDKTNRLAMDFMLMGNPAYLTWIQLCDPDVYWEEPNLDRSIESVASPLYYAALLGLCTITRLLLYKGADTNTHGGHCDNTPQSALAEGTEQVVETLLSNGAVVNANGGRYGNPLQAASAKGHKNIVEMLLTQGADVNALGGRHGSALQAASFRGHWEVVKMLLEAGAAVDAVQRGASSSTALQTASAKGHKKVVETLLSKGANVNLQSGLYYNNALQAASGRGHKQIVEILLSKGADVNAKGGIYSSALQAASTEGYKKIVKILLRAGADVNLQGGSFYSNALQAASGRGYKQIVEMLLSKGADVNAKGGVYSSALQAASGRGYKKIVKTLLSKGANVNAQGEHGSALQAASYWDHKEVVQILLRAGADVNAQGKAGSALQAASAMGHEEIVELLLQAGAYELEEDDPALLSDDSSLSQASSEH